MFRPKHHEFPQRTLLGSSCERIRNHKCGFGTYTWSDGTWDVRPWVWSVDILRDWEFCEKRMCFSAGSKWYLCLGFLIRKRDEAVLGYHLPTRMGWEGKTGQLTCQLLGARTCFDRLVFDGFSHQFGIIMFCELRVGYPPHGAIYNYFGITYLFFKGRQGKRKRNLMSLRLQWGQHGSR